MAWMSGSQVGNGYTIEGVLGAGGFGMTYRALSAAGERVVIKTLQDHILQSPSWAPYRDRLRQGFYDEANRLFKLHDAHRDNAWMRHVVQVMHLFREGDLPCFVMEYLDGESLADRVQAGVISEADAVRWIEQVGRGLELVHREGVLHRDIKPENIMLRSDGSAVLIDFGIAREFTVGLEPQTQTVMGSDGYAPPEQYQEKAERGAFTDVYGLAATLYELLSGMRPPDARARLENDELLPLQGVSDRVCEAVMEGLRLDGRLRPRSVGQWLGLLLGEEVTLPLTERGEPLQNVVTNNEKNWELIHRLSVETKDLLWRDAVAFSSISGLIAANDDKYSNIKLWDLKTGNSTCIINYGEKFGRIHKLAFSQDGLVLVGIFYDSNQGYWPRLIAWEISTGKEIFSKKLDKNWLAVMLNDNGDLLASVEPSPATSFSPQLRIQVSQVRTDHTLQTLVLDQTSCPVKMTFSRDKRYLATRQSQAEISIWEIATGRLIRTVMMPPLSDDAKWFSYPMLFSPNGELFVASTSQNMNVWKVETGENVYTIEYFQPRYIDDPCIFCTFSSDEQTLAVLDEDASQGWLTCVIKLLDVSSKQVGTVKYFVSKVEK